MKSNTNSRFKAEESKFIKERKNREKKYSWENYPQLFAEEKLYYTEEDKKLIQELLYNPIKPEYRKEFWFISTGAKLEWKNNPGYYQKLVNLSPEFQNLTYFKNIEDDKTRTFFNNPFFQKEVNVNKLANILKAFTIRNCASIGYCQGFNFIAGQLFYILQDEEKAFWCFTKIIEDYLPLYYYLDMRGVLVDSEIMIELISKKMAFLKNNKNLDAIIRTLMNQCFTSLFSEIYVDSESSYIIWDNFFIKGGATILRAFKFYAFYLFDSDTENYDLVKASQKVGNIKNEKNINLLNYFLLMDEEINNSSINESRKKELEKIYKNAKPKYENKNEIKPQCNLKIPYCFYNEVTKKIERFSEFKIFKIKENIKNKKNENYFSDLFKNYEFGDNNAKVIKNEISDDNNLDDILMERMEHVCQNNPKKSE